MYTSRYMVDPYIPAGGSACLKQITVARKPLRRSLGLVRNLAVNEPARACSSDLSLLCCR